MTREEFSYRMVCLGIAGATICMIIYKFTDGI